jgi:hypothetical protein
MCHTTSRVNIIKLVIKFLGQSQICIVLSYDTTVECIIAELECKTKSYHIESNYETASKCLEGNTQTIQLVFKYSKM